MRPPLSVGERVARVGQFPGEPQRLGTVVDCYCPRTSHQPTTDPPHLYAVTWEDTGLTERGYMDGGLKRVAVLATPLVRI